MKKRLLSAVLAFAMVLTMLPLSAFAASAGTSSARIFPSGSDVQALGDDDSGTYTLTWRKEGYVFRAANANATPAVTELKATCDGWYFWGKKVATDTANTLLYASDSGVVATTNATGSGVWYKSLEDAVSAKKTAVVLAGNESTGMTSKLATNLLTTLTVDLNGHTLGGTFEIPNTYSVTDSNGQVTSTPNNTFSTLTIKDSAQTGTNWNTTNASTFAVKVGDTGAPKPTATTITLQNVSTNGAVTATYTTACTVNLKNAKTGAITLSGTSGGAVNVGTGTSEKGEAGAVKITTTGTATGGKVTAYNATITSVELSGVGASLTGTNSNVGAVTLLGSTDSSLTETQKGSLAAPSVTLTGGSATAIGAVAGSSPDVLSKAYGVTLNAGVMVGAITLANATVAVNNSSTAAITVDNGSVSVAGSASAPATTEAITLGAEGKTASLTVTGTNVTIGGITAKAGTVNITVPNSDTNVFGALTSTVAVANRGISGGVWASAVPAANLNNLQYQVARKDNKYVYYTSSQFQKLIDEYQVETKPTITVVGDSGTGSSSTLTFMNGEEVLTAITYYKPSLPITLPTTVNGGPVSKWTECEASSSGGSVTAGNVIRDLTGSSYSTPSPAADRVLSTQVTDSAITKLESVASGVPGLTARLNGTVITLSGAIPQGTSEIKLEITTDGKNPIKDLPVTVVYENGTVRFANQTLSNGLWITPDWNYLVMPNDVTRYSLNGSGLKVQAEKLKDEWVHGYSDECPVIVTVNCSGSAWTTIRKNELAKLMTNDEWTSGSLVSSGSAVDFSESPAVLEALNAVVAGISDSQVSSWLLNAQNAAWRKVNNTTPTAEQRTLTGYNEVHVVAYMAVNVTNYSATSTPGTLTMTLTPSYYVEVRQSTPTGYEAYVLDPTVSAQLSALRPVNNRTLGSLTGDIGKVTLKLNVESAFKTIGAYAHQGNTYVYKNDDSTSSGGAGGPTSRDAGSNTITLSIDHSISNALGQFVINGNAPMVTLFETDAKSTPLGYYDTLQAAVDDAEEDNYIDVDANYSGNCAISVTGKARKFQINTNGANRVTSNVTGVVTEKTSGTLYEVQLTADNVVNTTSVTVGTVTGGTARTNATTATKPGDTVTITATANSGYRALAPTVRTNTGTTVTVTAGSTDGTWTFVIPSGATSITVTPSFVLDTGLPFTDVTADAWYYDGVAYCYNTITSSGNRLMQGDGAGATTFRPNAAVSRAEVVEVLYNLAGRPTPGAARVTYTDVAASNWAYNAITWATNMGYAQGYGDGRFGPGDTVVREDFVTFLWRYANSPTVSNSLAGYTDGGGIHSWALPAMRWAAAYGILSGTNSVALNGSLSPFSGAYRSQVAVTLQKYHQLYG